jgi:hypothetical protein
MPAIHPTSVVAALAGLLLAAPVTAQHTGHDDSSHRAAAALPPASGGSAAFTTIAEVVKLLQADSTTDWSAVDLERLRQHLIDMDEVTLRARVVTTPVTGGLRMDVRGTGRTRDAIRNMVRDHARMVSSGAVTRAVVSESADGVVLTVTAADVRDTGTVQRVRGLGFIGWLTQPDHHAEHHVAIARGAMGSHRH